MARGFLLAAIVALALSAGAGAVIVPQKGIAGVSIGMSKGKVRSVLGKPVAVKRGSTDFGTYTLLRYRGLTVTFQGNRSVTSISTTRKTERTARGIGVGSTEAQVRSKVKGVRCETDGGYRHCFVGRFGAGERVTDFAIKRGRVSRVAVGVVID